MPRLVEDVVIVRKSTARIQHIMEGVATFAAKYPDIATAGVLAKLTNWTPQSISTNAEQLGISLRQSSKGSRISLGSLLESLITEGKEEQVLEFYRDVQVLRATVTEDIYEEEDVN